MRAAGLVAGAFCLWVAVLIVALPRRDSIPTPAPPYVVVLSSSVRADSTLDHAGATRLEGAIAYARAHGARVITSTVYGEHDAPSLYAQRAALGAAGLVDRWTALSGSVASTHDEALALREVLTPGTPIAVVTSPLHSRRACAVYEKAGFRVTCVPSAPYRWWFVPYAVAYETLATVKYKWYGWW